MTVKVDAINRPTEQLTDQPTNKPTDLVLIELRASD